MVEAPLQDDVQCFAQLCSLINTQETHSRKCKMTKHGRVGADRPRIYLVLKFRDDDVEMHED